MKFFKKLFAKKEQTSPEVPDQESKEPSPKDDMIRVHDEYGREVMIDRQTWIDNVLLGNLENNYNNPDALYGLIVTALNDGFTEHVEKASAHLFDIDPMKERGACIRAVVLMENNKLDEAEKVLTQIIPTVDNPGVLLTNLAKIQSKRGDNDQAKKTLWSALEADPNQDNGLDWYVAIEQECGGQSAYLDALTRASLIPSAWRPQLWLARHSLEQGKKQTAIEFYEQFFQRNQAPDAQVLQQISGDLGKNGHIIDIIGVIRPHFNIQQHGFSVGNNLIKAYIELKRYTEAKQLVDTLFAENRPDWKEGLVYWDAELDKLMGDYGPAEGFTESQVQMMSIDRPTWLLSLKHEQTLIPKKVDKPFRIVTTSASCTATAQPEEVTKQKTNDEGTLCRGFPLSFCDHINLHTNAQATMLIPVIAPGSFVLYSQRCEDSAIESIAHRSSYDLLIVPHLYADKDQWVMELRLFESSKSEAVQTLRKAFNTKSDDIGILLKSLQEDLHCYLLQHYPIDECNPIVDLRTISSHLYAHYIDSNSRCLALSMAVIYNDSSTLYGERNIMDQLLLMAAEESTSDAHTLMFFSALAKNKSYGSSIYTEYERKLDRLLKDHPTNFPISEVLSKTAEDLYKKVAST
ncbi:MAG: tetratricopeptide repeat protein [Pseudomonadales bacterium]|nr:tetratricopeptide repeat protein [Pseudomonadales bacterium]